MNSNRVQLQIRILKSTHRDIEQRHNDRNKMRNGRVIFRPVEISDKAAIEAAVPPNPLLSCEYCFANLFSWRKACGTRWGLFKGHLTAFFEKEDEILMPAGSEPDPEDLYDFYLDVFPDGDGCIAHIPAKYIGLFPSIKDLFEVEKCIDHTEYIHETENLFNLNGSKFHNKKNLLNQFIRNNPGFEVRKASRKFIPECFSLAEKWYEDKTCKTFGITHERSAIKESLDNFEELGLEGVLIFCGGSLTAFSVFSIFNGTCIVHFEKYDRSVKGAAQAINYETAKSVLGKCRYINREQDLGIEGLRKAKSSYCPDIFDTDFTLTKKKVC